MNCILCGNDAEKFEMWRDNQYYKCNGCSSIFLDPKDYINIEKEKKRYEKHNNDVENPGYQKFVSPIVKEVLKDYRKDHKGLDFGAGTGPVIAKLLKDKGYNIQIYDPFFADYPRRLEEKYDYIVSCEVIEHFHNPREEFKLLKSILKSDGRLYIMTDIYSEDIDFKSWSYKNDITHVFFYHKKALEWIRKKYKFTNLKIEKNLIIYRI